MAERGAQPGNTNATKNRPFAQAINTALAQGDGTKLRAIAEKLIDMAASGDLGAIKEFADRADGKAMQAIEASGPGGGPIILAQPHDEAL